MPVRMKANIHGLRIPHCRLLRHEVRPADVQGALGTNRASQPEKTVVIGNLNINGRYYVRWLLSIGF